MGDSVHHLRSQSRWKIAAAEAEAVADLMDASNGHRQRPDKTRRRESPDSGRKSRSRRGQSPVGQARRRGKSRSESPSKQDPSRGRAKSRGRRKGGGSSELNGDADDRRRRR